MIARESGRKDLGFALGCALIYGLVTLSLPSYLALIEPDSTTYLDFYPTRSALYPTLLTVCRQLGLSLLQITWIQLAFFCVALAYLLVVLRRCWVSRLLLAVLVGVLTGNILFSSFHFSILTESLYFSLGVFVAGLWIEYFRSGRARNLVAAGILLGLMMGLRPVAMALVPMQIIAVIWRRPERMARWLMIVLTFASFGVGVAGERLLYWSHHHHAPRSTAPLLLMGKAAMLIEPDMTFSGPYAEDLQSLGRALYARVKPIRDVLEAAPSVAVRLHFAAAFEGQAQDEAFLRDELVATATKAGVGVDDLRSELGRQVILGNLGSYFRLTAITEIGQWSVAAQRFPPVAAAINAFASANPVLSREARLHEEMLHPQPWRAAWIVYPAFLAVGAVTFLLALLLPVLFLQTTLWESSSGFYCGLAVFFSAMCHMYTLFISLANVWTPRFLMAVFPQLEVVALCVLLGVVHRRRPPAAARASRRRPTG